MKRFDSRKKAHKKGDSGFTIVELLVSAILASIVVAIVYSLYVSYSKVVINQEERVEVQQIGRMALNTIKSDLMLIGRNSRNDRGQESVVYAAPWEMLFNADLSPAYGGMVTGGTVSYGPSNGLTYTGNQTAWQSDAETIHYYMHLPSTAEDYSFSPYDREIRRQINNNTNSADRIAYGVRYDDGSMAYADGFRVAPLFSYWGDFDLNPDTEDTLWGDSNGDGRLSSAEIGALYGGSYSWTNNLPSGITINNSSIPKGAIFVGRNSTNSEDLDNDGELDPGEDINGNRRLDTNLLDLVLHRVEVNITTVGQFKDETFSHPHESTYHFRESNVRTAVDPRNLLPTYDSECGNPPGNPTNVTLTQDECGRSLILTWDASADDGSGENDVIWYEIFRKVGTGSGGNWTYYSYMPARAQSSYQFVDKNVSREWDETIPPEGAWVYYTHTYRVVAVDKCDQRSNCSSGCNSNSVLPNPSYPNEPTNLTAFKSPCYKNSAVTGADVGSVTIEWTPATSGGSEDTSIEEYWIYRSAPLGSGSTDIGVVPEPIAKVDPNASYPTGPHSCAGTGSTSWHDAHHDCTVHNSDPTFFDYTPSGATVRNLVWRDELDSPGRGGSSILPVNSGQFGIGLDETHYYYEVKAYDEDSECLSDPAVLQEGCYPGQFCEATSFDTGVYSGNQNRSRFTPPMNFTVADSSIMDVTGAVTPRFKLEWTQSATEWCEEGGGDPAIPDIGRYYIYRSKTYLTWIAGQPRSIMLDPNHADACGFNFTDADEIMVYRGPAATNPSDGIYTFYDENSLAGTDTDHASYDLIGSTDLRPSNISYHNDLIYFDDASGNAPVYEYMVAAVTTDSAGAPTTSPWSFGASCVKQSAFECPYECVNHIHDSDVFQCSLRSAVDDGSDDASVYFQFEDLIDPGTVIHLVGRKAPDQPWELIDIGDTYDPVSGEYYFTQTSHPQGKAGIWYKATHAYRGGGTPGLTECPTCERQDPPTLWEYAIEIQCPDSECVRYLPTGQVLSAGLPDPLSICFNPNDSSCPSDTIFDCETGKITFQFDENLVRCVDNAQVPTTDRRFTWFRVIRWSKPPSNDATVSSWPWCRISGPCLGPYPPRTGWETCCQDPSHLTYLNLQDADKIYYVRGDGTCPTSWAGAGSVGPEYECFPLALANPSGRTFKFSEYVNPQLDYWYMIETRIDHDLAHGTGNTRPPRCCPESGAAGMCPETYNNEDTCNGGFPENVVSYEHIQCYPDWTPDPNQNPGTHNWERFSGWSGNIEGPDSSPTAPDTNNPWSNWEWTIIEWNFWGIHFYLGDHMFKYANNRIETDMETFFGDLLNWVVEWAYNVMFGMCDWCFEPWGLTLFCVDWFWPSCHDDLVNIKNHSYLWSNFDTNLCGATAPGSSQTLYGDMFMQFHARCKNKDTRFVLVFRGTYRPSPSGFNHYAIEVDFDHDPSGGSRIYYRLGYNHSDTYKEYVANYDDFHSDVLDNMWWTNLLLVCTNHVSGDTDYNHTFVYFWSKQDNTLKQWDWQSADGEAWLYARDPKIAFSTKSKTAPGTSTALNSVENKNGKVGFWADPFVDWQTDNFYYDNIRITKYCGKCPPDGLIAYTKSDGKEMPDGWKGKEGIWAEVF